MGYFWGLLGNFGDFWAILGIFGDFWSFSPISGQIGPNFGVFRALLRDNQGGTLGLHIFGAFSQRFGAEMAGFGALSDRKFFFSLWHRIFPPI